MAQRRPRWQPPHTDPRDRLEPKPDPERLCRWRGCPNFHSPFTGIDVPLCRTHIGLVLAAADRAETEKRQQREALEAKIEAGVRLSEHETAPGWIYYIRTDDTIKIGYAANVSRRMRSYPPTAELMAVEPGTRKLEAARHDHFHAYLAHGREWFRDVTEIREWIDTLVTEYGKPDDMAYRYTTPRPDPVVAGKHINRRW